MSEKPNIQIGNITISALMIAAGIALIALPVSNVVKICGGLIVLAEIILIIRTVFKIMKK